MFPFDDARGRAPDEALRRAIGPRALLAAGTILLGAMAADPAVAQQQTFNNANTLQLNNVICSGPAGGAGPGLGPNLAAICAARARAGVPLDVSGAGIISSVPPSTEQRQQQRDQELAEAEEKGSGGSADMQRFRLFGDTSLALSIGADSVVHPSNAYEEPFHASSSAVTVAVNTHPLSWLNYGLGFTYQHYAGSFEDLGGFNINTYRPFLFATVTPANGMFIDATLAYARIGNTRDRGANVMLGNTMVSRGIAAGTPGENGYTGSILSGYDRQFGRLTIGPRLGFNVGTWNMPAYQETGNTGLELRYQAVTQSSLQSTLGGAASMVFPTAFGAVVSTVTAGWVHEFEAYSQLIHAQFVQAPGSPFFTYSSQKPAANYGVLAITVSTALPGGARPYATFGTLLGNGVYQSYGGMVGVTFGW